MIKTQFRDLGNEPLGCSARSAGLHGFDENQRNQPARVPNLEKLFVLLGGVSFDRGPEMVVGSNSLD